MASHQTFLIQLYIDPHVQHDPQELVNLCHKTRLIRCPERISLRRKIAYRFDDTMFRPKMGNCFLVNLLNLAVPAWEQVNCSLPLMQQVFCQIENKEVHPASLQMKPNTISCLKGYILQNNMCYLFAWHKLETSIQETCSSNRLQTFHFVQFKFLFKAVSDVFPPMFSPGLEYIFTYKRHWNTFSYKLNSAYKEKSGLYVCARHQSQYLTSDQVFKCLNGIYISYKFVCDGNKDCPGEVSIDEIGCECNVILNYTQKCKIIKTSSEDCSDFYFKSWNNKCMLFEVSIVNGKDSDTRIASKGNQESLVQKLINNNQWKETKRGNLSCQSIELSKLTLYDISEICSYRLNKQGHLAPCYKGEHLQDCQQFECNMMFKCPDFYCIPWHYICDGKWDCPSGHDESIYHLCSNRTCINMFKCKMSSTCLHLDEVCNEHFNCPYQDDEYLCLLKDIKCPPVCHCTALAIRCYNVNILEDTLSIHLPYIAVTMLSCTLFIEDQLKTVFQYVSFLFITNTNLKKLCDVVSLMKHTKLLHSSNNAINTIRSHCFKNINALKVIKLNNNMLHYIQKFAFCNLTNILYIDLSNNKLTVVSKHSFIGSEKLSFLSLQNTTLDVRSIKYLLNSLKIKLLQSEYFSLCCSESQNFECSAKKPWYIACSALLVNNVFNYTFCLMSFAVIILNVLQLILQKKYEGKNRIFTQLKHLMTLYFLLALQILLVQFLCLYYG